MQYTFFFKKYILFYFKHHSKTSNIKNLFFVNNLFKKSKLALQNSQFSKFNDFLVIGRKHLIWDTLYLRYYQEEWVRETKRQM